MFNQRNTVAKNQLAYENKYHLKKPELINWRNIARWCDWKNELLWRNKSNNGHSEDCGVLTQCIDHAKSYPCLVNLGEKHGSSTLRSRSLCVLSVAERLDTSDTKQCIGEEPNCPLVFSRWSVGKHARRNAIDFSPVNLENNDSFDDDVRASSENLPSCDAGQCENALLTNDLVHELSNGSNERAYLNKTTKLNTSCEEIWKEWLIHVCQEEFLQYQSITNVCKRLTRSLILPSSPTVVLSAKQLSTQLECCYAYVHGGRDVSQSPIICLPHYPALRDITDEDFNNVLLYLTGTTRVSVADSGFVLIVDRRKDKWPAVRATLVRIAGYFPAYLRLVLVLRPIGFLQGTMSDIGFRWQRDEFSMKVVLISTLDELYTYVQPTQLPPEFGGCFDYDHRCWMKNRMLMEDFADQAVSLIESLEVYGVELSETELPNDVSSTETLIQVQESKTLSFKMELDRIRKEFINLKVKIPSTGNENTEIELLDNDVDFSRANEAYTLQNFSSLVEETEAAFERLWEVHAHKLSQCLELRRFEQEYREVKLRMDMLLSWIENQSSCIGNSVKWVKSMIKELEEKSKELKIFVNLSLAEEAGKLNINAVAEKLPIKKELQQTTILINKGKMLLDKEHYASDSIGPKTDEIRSITTQVEEAFQKRNDVLVQSLSFLNKIDEGNLWCEQGTNLLASQTLEKACAVESAEQALDELENFFDENKCLRFGNSKEETRDEFSLAWCSELEALFDNLQQRKKEVRKLYEKRKSSFKKVTTRHGDRPVQLVEPSKKSVKDAALSTANRSKTTKPPEKTSKRNSVITKRRSKLGQVSGQNSSQSIERDSNHCDAANRQNSEEAIVKQQHVMNELLHTEKVYVDELRSIVEVEIKSVKDPTKPEVKTVDENQSKRTREISSVTKSAVTEKGYGKEIESPDEAILVPEELKGNVHVLLGNMDEIYHFHGDIFFADLKEFETSPSEVGKCFIRRKESFHIYCNYCQNSMKSEKLRSRIGEHHPFFVECQRKLGHRLSLGAYLLKPIQRLTKYQLLLQQMLKHETKDSTELEEAIQAMLDILKSVNDSMHQIAIVGYQGDLSSLGKLLMQGAFSVQVDHKKAGVKSLTKSRFTKPMQRHLFLYGKELIFCKQQNMENSATNDTSSSASWSFNHSNNQVYLFKHSLQMNAVGITDKIKHDPRKFEIWYHGREDVYTVTAPSANTKQEWVKEIKHVLESQPKSSVTPPNPYSAEDRKPTAKVKRSLSARKTKEKQVDAANDHQQHDQSTAGKTSSDRLNKAASKKKSSLSRSASLGKSKEKVLKTKTSESKTKSSAVAKLPKTMGTNDEAAPKCDISQDKNLQETPSPDTVEMNEAKGEDIVTTATTSHQASS